METVFSITQESADGFVAGCPSRHFFSGAGSGEKLRANVCEAVVAYFFDQPGLKANRLRFVRDDLRASA